MLRYQLIYDNFYDLFGYNLYRGIFFNNGGLDFTRGKFNVLVKSGSLYPSDFNSNESSLHQNIKTYISNLLFIFLKIELK